MKKTVLTTGQMRQALLAQPLLQARSDIADWFVAQKLQAKKFSKNACLIRDGDTRSKNIFLITSGKTRVEISGFVIGYRDKNEHVGEMAFIMEDKRTASVFVEETSVIITIPEHIMRKACDTFPILWKGMAETLCKRLHQRRAIFRAANKTPRVFIGSSSASKRVVNKLVGEMKGILGKSAHLRPWTADDIFTPSSVIVQTLIDEAKEADFSVFVLAADDRMSHRGLADRLAKTNKVVPRDNVIFEGGMFVAACGLKRTFFLSEKHSSLHIPTDLAGVTHLSFSRTHGGTRVCLNGAAQKIAKQIDTQGVITGRTTS